MIMLRSLTRSVLIAMILVASFSAVPVQAQEAAGQETVERVPTLCHESFNETFFEPIEKVLEQKPDPSVHFYLAECYRSFGKIDDAKNHYLMALSFLPIFDRVMKMLEEAKQARDEPENVQADYTFPALRDEGPSR